MLPISRTVARAAAKATCPIQGHVFVPQAARAFVVAAIQQQPAVYGRDLQKRAFQSQTALREAVNMGQRDEEPMSKVDEARRDARENRLEKKNSIFVGNLPIELTMEDVNQIFAPYGQVKRAVKGEGGTHWFIYFEDEATAIKVQQETHGLFVRGRQMRVQPRLGFNDAGQTGYRRQPDRANEYGGEASPTIFIGNMPYNMTDQDLNDLSKKLEYCFDIRVAIDRNTGWPRGYAHADFYTIGLAQRAFKKLTDTQLRMGDNTLRLDFAQGSRGGATSFTLSRLRALKTAGKTLEDFEKLTEELRAKEGDWMA